MKLSETVMQNESTLHSMIHYFKGHELFRDIAEKIDEAAGPLHEAVQEYRKNPRSVESLKLYWECEIDGRICDEGYVYQVRYFCDGVPKVESGPVLMPIRDSDLYSDMQDAVLDIAFQYDLNIGAHEVTVSKDDLCAVWTP